MKSVQYTITYYDDKNNNTLSEPTMMIKNNNTLSESTNILQAP